MRLNWSQSTVIATEDDIGRNKRLAWLLFCSQLILYPSSETALPIDGLWGTAEIYCENCPSCVLKEDVGPPSFFFFFLSVLVSMCLLSVQLYMLDNFFLKKWSQFLLSLKCQQQTSGFQCKYDDSSCPNYTKLFPHILCYLWGQLRSNSEIASSPWISSHFSQVNTAWKRILRGNFAKYGLEGIAKLFSNGWIEKKKKNVFDVWCEGCLQFS